MKFVEWTSAAETREFALSFDQSRNVRVLFIPPLFDEANKLRRLTVEVMRRCDASGVDSLLPDLPGCHESLTPLSQQSLSSWRSDIDRTVEQFGATHVFSVRGGAAIAPVDLSGWNYAPVTGARILRGLLRSRVISSREAGLEETRENLLAKGKVSGLTLAGYDLCAAMISELADHSEIAPSGQIELLQSDIGGAGLWLGAEPGDDPDQVDALAAAIMAGAAS